LEGEEEIRFKNAKAEFLAKSAFSRNKKEFKRKNVDGSSEGNEF